MLKLALYVLNLHAQPLCNFFFSRFHLKVDLSSLVHPGCAWIAAHSGSAPCSLVPLDVTGVFLRNRTVLKTQYIACFQMTVMYPSSIYIFFQLSEAYSSSMIAVFPVYTGYYLHNCIVIMLSVFAPELWLSTQLAHRVEVFRLNMLEIRDQQKIY